MVEEGPITLRRRGELLDQMGKLPEMVLVELAEPLKLRGLVLMMRQRVVRVGNPDLGGRRDC